MKKLKKNALVLGMSLLFGSIAALVMYFLPLDLIDNMENVAYDWRYRFKYSGMDPDAHYPDYGIHIVDIDEYSMSNMGTYWNWDRGYQASMINALTARFPAAIVYDVLFYDPEDANHQRRLMRALHAARSATRRERDTSLTADSAAADTAARIRGGTRAQEIDNYLLSLINYDKQFEEAIANSGRVTMCLVLQDSSDYHLRGVGAVAHRMTMAWHDTLNPASTLDFPDSLLKHINRRKTIIGGIYPENARAAQQIGHINMESVDDVARKVPLLYRFGDYNPMYLPISVRVPLTLFGTPNEEVKFVPNKYIDIGKPFKIFRNDDGTLRFSYPDFTEAQLRAILAVREDILALQEQRKIDVSAYVAIYRDESSNGEPALELRNSKLPRDLTEILLAGGSTLDEMEKMKVDEEIDIDDGFFVLREPDGWEIDGFFISEAELKSLRKLSMDDLKMDEGQDRKLLLFDFWVKRERGVLVTPIPTLRAETLRELIAGSDDPAASIAPGGRRDFGNAVRIPLRDNNLHIVTYFGRSKIPFPYYSFYDIMEDRIKASMEGRIFIIGSSAPALFDIIATPHEQFYPGPEIHASIMNSILTDTFVRRLEGWQDLLIMLLAGFIIAAVAFLTKPLWAIICAVAAMAVYTFAALQVFDSSLLWIDIIRPILTIILTFTAVVAYRYMTEEKDRKYLQSTFKQYLSPELIEIMYTEKQAPKLGGDKGICTAYFTDIEGFSTFSEKLGDPAKLVDLLNEYLTSMTDILSSRRGTLDKYIGDAIVAFFGAPMPMADHAIQACNTALDMQRKLADLREKWTREKCNRRCTARPCGEKCGEKEKWPNIVHNMRMRIGINTGEIITGNMGSSMRMNYTMMGDAVNLAARLESAAKQFGVYTLVSEYTYEQTKDNFEVRQIDIVTVVGKTKPVTIYELLAKKGEMDPATKEMLEQYNLGVERYYARDWKTAIKYFEKSAELEMNKREFPDKPNKANPSKRFIEMCEKFIENPPDDNWNGVRKMDSK